MKNKNLLLVSTLALLTACGGGGGGGSSSTPKKEVKPLEVQMMGVYQALLSPLNKKVSGHINGSLTLVREEDDFIADVRLSGGEASVLHAQNIHTGTRCPTEKDDLNGDGFIDGEEGAKVYGDVIIPLDDDISSQWVGLGTFPVTDQFGYYFWSRAVKFEKMMEDLKEHDINLKDEYIKLAQNETLNLVGKVVVIKGVSPSTALPATVVSRGRATPHQGLPIACAVIRPLKTVPGTIDDDHTGIPLPEGGAIGGSSGGNDGADFEDDGTIRGDGGNYGEEGEVTTTNDTGDFDT